MTSSSPQNGRKPAAPRLRALATLCALLVCLAASRLAPACSSVDPSHAEWSELLSRRVEGGRVDYAGLIENDLPALDGYLATLSSTCAEDYTRWSRAAKIAFWINAYNAFTVRLIANHYPLDSIRNIGWLPGAAFRKAFIPMQGLRSEATSLDDIEHRVLRAGFGEPRIHFALVCAARSCPPLRTEAYRGADLAGQLDDQGRQFLGDRAKNRVDSHARTLYLSKVFYWFRSDFETQGSLAAFVAPYLGAPAQDVTGFAIEFLPYDWSLNDY